MELQCTLNHVHLYNMLLVITEKNACKIHWLWPSVCYFTKIEHKQSFHDLICINIFTNMKNISVSVGLIDYNFHCFRKAIQEVFEVRMKVVRSRKHQSHMQKNKRPTPNGTPRMPL